MLEVKRETIESKAGSAEDIAAAPKAPVPIIEMKFGGGGGAGPKLPVIFSGN